MGRLKYIAIFIFILLTEGVAFGLMAQGEVGFSRGLSAVAGVLLLTASYRRLGDAGMSRYYNWLLIVPIVKLVVALVLCFTPTKAPGE